MKKVYVIFDKLSYDNPIYCIVSSEDLAKNIIKKLNDEDKSNNFYYEDYEIKTNI